MVTSDVMADGEAEEFGIQIREQRTRSRMSAVEVEEWMCVGLWLLMMVRFVLSRMPLSALRERFVGLQLKSVCLALKSPIMIA